MTLRLFPVVVLLASSVVPIQANRPYRRQVGSMFKTRLRQGNAARGLYSQEWVKKAVAKGKADEKKRWAMFGDDGTLPRPVINDCSELRATADRVRTYPPTVKHVKIAQNTKMGSPRILCWVFTNVGFHETKAKAVRLTWGKRCDGFLFMSNLADPALPSIVLKNDQEDDFGNLWHKMQIAMLRLADEYAQQYDWFYKCDDDTFPLMENLRAYLLSDQVKAIQAKGHGAFVGRRMNNTRAQAGPHVDDGEITLYNGGGSGYLFDREGLKRTAALIRAKDPRCLPQHKTHSDDLMLGNCATHAGVPIVDTRDDKGGERFHVFDPEICSSYRLPTDIAKAKKEDWYFAQTVNPKPGMAHCSPESVAFHHLSPQMIVDTEALWYKCNGVLP